MVDCLVVLNGGAAVTGCGNDNTCTTGNQALDNLDTDRSFTDTSEKSVLILECSARGSDFSEDVEI